MVAQMIHPNIVSIYDVVETDDFFGVVLEIRRRWRPCANGFGIEPGRPKRRRGSWRRWPGRWTMLILAAYFIAT